MGHRDHYKPNVPSVTELLHDAGYYDQFPNDPQGFYFRRGNFVNDCCDIIAAGDKLDRNRRWAGELPREKPLTVKEENKQEQWIGYVKAYQAWMQRYRKFKLIAAQKYLLNEIEGYQGTLDQLVKLDDMLALVELKAVAPGASCPPATPLQTAGYWLCLDPRPKLRIGLALRADCTFKESIYKNYADFSAFRLMIRWNYIAKNYR